MASIKLPEKLLSDTDVNRREVSRLMRQRYGERWTLIYGAGQLEGVQLESGALPTGRPAFEYVPVEAER
jgi:hypothetical protein